MLLIKAIIITSSVYCEFIYYDVVKKLVIVASSHTGYDNVFNFSYDCSTPHKISLPVRFLSPQFQLLVAASMLYSLFPLTSGTHCIYVGTIEQLGAWGHVFVLIWGPLSRRFRLLNRVRHFLSILSLECIHADLLSGIAQSISLRTLLETGPMLSIP